MLLFLPVYSCLSFCLLLSYLACLYLLLPICLSVFSFSRLFPLYLSLSVSLCLPYSYLACLSLPTYLSLLSLSPFSLPSTSSTNRYQNNSLPTCFISSLPNSSLLFALLFSTIQDLTHSLFLFPPNSSSLLSSLLFFAPGLPIILEKANHLSAPLPFFPPPPPSSVHHYPPSAFPPNSSSLFFTLLSTITLEKAN